MAKNEQKVMAFVEKELAANPGISTTDLFDKAKKVDAGVNSLSLRQFNARFPLQIKRKQSLAKPGRKRTGSTGGGRRRSRQGQEEQRLAVRKVFLRFATELSAAEERRDLVEVLSKVDDYVADAIKATGR
ncbi:MAG: hypothetical protein EA350_17525 [Gemmatimonadales bacterium]|nr:MAG: hypothetical protein EA350_17525 [Gemmatimonadales bacterium]